MKKVYEKPMLYAESYELAEHVAGGCALDDMNQPTLRSLESCGFVEGIFYAHFQI